MAISQVTLDTSFKQFVAETRGLRLADIKCGTALYRKLVKEFNRLKQTFLAIEEGEIRRQARMLSAEEGLEAVILAGIVYSWVLGAIASI